MIKGAHCQNLFFLIPFIRENIRLTLYHWQPCISQFCDITKGIILQKLSQAKKSDYHLVAVSSPGSNPKTWLLLLEPVDLGYQYCSTVCLLWCHKIAKRRVADGKESNGLKSIFAKRGIVWREYHLQWGSWMESLETSPKGSDGGDRRPWSMATYPQAAAPTILTEKRAMLFISRFFVSKLVLTETPARCRRKTTSGTRVIMKSSSGEKSSSFNLFDVSVEYLI